MNRREQLEQTKPQRADFESQAEFEETLGFWMSRTGRFLAHNKESLAQQPAQANHSTTEQATMHDEVMGDLSAWLPKKRESPV